jgi:preprotein translocase subunit YajC
VCNDKKLGRACTGWNHQWEPRQLPRFDDLITRAASTDLKPVKQQISKARAYWFWAPATDLACAQAAAGGAGGAGGLISFVPIILIFAIMYFLMIRPQQKKVKEHRAMVEALRRGDQVVTSGGLIGKVTKVAEGEIEVELAPSNVKVRVVRSTITQVVSKTEPAEA